MGRFIICTFFTKQYWDDVVIETDVAKVCNIIAGVRTAYKILVRKRVEADGSKTKHKCEVKTEVIGQQKWHMWYLMVWNSCPLCCLSHRYPARKILCVWHCTLWWWGLCVFGLWEGIHSTDQFEKICETPNWWETSPQSLWWKFRPETWSEKTYCRTAWSKRVVWSIHVFWNVTRYSITSQLMWILTSARLLAQLFQMVWNCFILCIYLILSVFCVNMCYRSILCSRTVSHVVFFPLERSPTAYFFKFKALI